MQSSQAHIYKVITSDIRRGMLVELVSRDLAPEDFALIFDLSPSAITRHLKILEKAGFISRYRRGRYIFCHLKATGSMLMKVDWRDRFLL